MRVLVTRPLEDALQTALELARLDCEAVVAPLFEVQFAEGPAPLSRSTQAILATSGNAVRALALRSKRRDVPIVTVGSHTAAIARTAGFARVIDARGDSAALADEVCRRLSRTGGPLLIAAGKHTRSDLKRTLETAGFRVLVWTAYEAVAATVLPVAAHEALASESLDAVLLFSPRSARVLADCVLKAGLGRACLHLTACCISRSAAHALTGVPFAEVRIATQPDQSHLLALLRPGLRSNARKS